MLSKDELVGCPDCDLIQHRGHLRPGETLCCERCGHVLAKGKRAPVERTIALSIAALTLCTVANVFPFLTLKAQGQFTEATIPSGIVTIWEQGMEGLAVLVGVTAVLAPSVYILALLYLHVPLALGVRVPWAIPIFRWLGHVRPWSMAEVFMLGVLVSMVKLADLADIVPGIALWAFALMIPALAAAISAVDEHAVWEWISPSRDAS